jgi:hypothetical protein
MRTLFIGTRTAGRHEILCAGENNRGQRVASGIYFLPFISKDARTTQKLTVLK